MQVIEARKLTRARNVVFNDTKVLGFKKESRNIEDNLPFDVSFDEENLELDNTGIVKTEIKENPSELLVETENKECEDKSSSYEAQNHVESTRIATIVPEVSSNEPPVLRNITFNPQNQVLPISPRTSVGPSPPRPSRIPVLQGRPCQANDVQQTSQTVKGERKILGKLDKAKQLVKTELPSNSDT